MRREYKVYTKWKLAIPFSRLAKATCDGQNIYLSWEGHVVIKVVEEKYVPSLNEANLLRKELVPSESVRESRKEIIERARCVSKKPEHSLMLSQGLIMLLKNENSILEIETRQKPKIYRKERTIAREISDNTVSYHCKWISVSNMIRKNTEIYEVYCPLCNQWFRGSSYLSTVFSDERTLWLANMITHYRHEHITSWNKMWGSYGWSYQTAAHYNDEDYEDRKSEINERAKRQIIRKATSFLKNNNITLEIFDSLQGTSEKTREVAIKYFL